MIAPEAMVEAAGSSVNSRKAKRKQSQAFGFDRAVARIPDGKKKKDKMGGEENSAGKSNNNNNGKKKKKAKKKKSARSREGGESSENGSVEIGDENADSEVKITIQTRKKSGRKAETENTNLDLDSSKMGLTDLDLKQKSAFHRGSGKLGSGQELNRKQSKKKGMKKTDGKKGVIGKRQ